MRLRLWGEGRRYKIYFVDLGDERQPDCPVSNFLDRIEREQQKTGELKRGKKNLRRMLRAIFVQQAGNGPLDKQEALKRVPVGVFE